VTDVAAARILPKLRVEQARLDRLHRCMRGERGRPHTHSPHRGVHAAGRALPDQPAVACGQRGGAGAVRGGLWRSDGAGPASAWQWWQANGLDARSRPSTGAVRQRP